MRVSTKNEYDNLIYCLTAYPCSLQITGDINKDTAIKQYNNLINTLIEFGVKVKFLDLNNSPSQVFTKDIGFVIDELMFISNMTDSVRQTEISKLIEVSKKQDIKVYHMKSKVEGGDVLVHNNKIFVGQGKRTTPEAVEEVMNVLNHNNMNYKLIKVNFCESKIHLDCVFNILDKDTCILSDDVFNPEAITKHFINVIKVPKSDADALALNIVNLGNKNILCCNENLNNTLLKHGYKSVLIEFTEIIKFKGSIGCCILEMLRGKVQ